ncbi:MAG: hypothetical protein JKY22_10200 [Flavobacteriaceae bacterium]|nr:hypothetical protein [Flavobacteriaceae bacterium]
MKLLRITLLLVIATTTLSFTVHKFYVSITKIEYSQEEASLQIISKLSIDDIEDVLQARYNPSLVMNSKKETEATGKFLKEYVLQKFIIEVNGEVVALNYLGFEYDIDVVKIFIEVKGVSELNSISVENKMLMELFEEQQNIIRVKRFKKRKSLVLDADNPKGLLNFN